MKNLLFIPALLLLAIGAIGQSKDYKFGVTEGAFIQHYNGNLGNSFFQFRTTCFAGGSATFGMYLNKSFDLNAGLSIGDFGYCQTPEDKMRIVAESQRCPGCKNVLGMGDLRSRMVSGNFAAKYKIANDYLLKENSKLAPYVFLGMGINRLADNMKRNCVNVGYHISMNTGTGLAYRITERFSIGYSLGLGCFISKKVYYTNAAATDSNDLDEAEQKMAKRKDLYMQNSLFIGVNF